MSETTSTRAVRNDRPDDNSTSFDQGLMIEVLVDGHFGHAATADLSQEGILRTFDRALQATTAASRHKVYRFSPEFRPIAKGNFRSARRRDLDSTSLGEITDALMAATSAMKISEEIVTRSAQVMAVKTEIDLISSNGTETHQDFNLIDLYLSATAMRGSEIQKRSFQKAGQFGGEVFDRPEIEREAARTAREALELLNAENCPEGRYDLLLAPDQMYLQIHESIGHPLEIDRILGDERNYAGWSFVQPADFGRLQYGSKLMNVTFDPTPENELASYVFDDGGAPAQKEYLIKNGILQRGLGSLESQKRSGLQGVANFRSASWNRAPIDRMANINIEPGTDSFDDLISRTERGIWMTTNNSWSIDDYRNKFQFGCEFARLIENGKLTRVLKNPGYRGVTVEFWNRLAAVGNRDSMETHGTFFCGKGEPSQVIRAGHASPPCLFEKVEVFGGHT